MPFKDPQHSERAKRLLADAPVIREACDLDLLVFLHRHPRTMLTSENLAAFVGYDMRQIGKALDAFVDAGILERIQSSTHAARMYLLSLQGPRGGGLKAVLELGSTREGRRKLLKVLDGRDPQTKSEAGRNLRLVKTA
ncbi:MAG: hypothetical protein JO138_00860 [Acidobacteriaceae bacterium]|nr:hypothetical protein [Acidobacteriaceae bacterium]